MLDDILWKCRSAVLSFGEQGGVQALSGSTSYPLFSSLNPSSYLPSSFDALLLAPSPSPSSTRLALKVAGMVLCFCFPKSVNSCPSAPSCRFSLFYVEPACSHSPLQVHAAVLSRCPVLYHIALWGPTRLPVNMHFRS